VQIEHWDERRDGILNEPNMRAKLEARGYRVSRYVYPPGTFFPEHEHAVDKIDGVLAGRFRMTLQGREVVLEPGDCLAVPRGSLHSAEVVGGAPVISLDAVKGAG
jgi:mannose-6-phosphate isomerase-like protein (cupin superfamily)